MARKPGSAAELILHQSRAMALVLDKAAEAVRLDPSPAEITQAQALARTAKLISDAGRSVIATEASALKALAADDAPPPPAARADNDDSEEVEMDDDSDAAIDMDEVDRARERLEREVAERVGRYERKSAPSLLRAGGRAGHRPPVEADLAPRAAPA